MEEYILYPRDENRYGTFLANSNIGEIIISIDISGFGELITITKDNKEITKAWTLTEDNDCGEPIVEENEDCIDIYIDTDLLSTIIIINKPFIRRIK